MEMIDSPRGIRASAPATKIGARYSIVTFISSDRVVSSRDYAHDARPA